MALADEVTEPNYTTAGFTEVSGGTSNYQTANNTAGYTLADNKVTYTAAVEPENLLTVSNVTSTDGLTFADNTLTIANNFADVATVTNTSSNEITVTNGYYMSILSASSSLVAGADWSYQDSTLINDGHFTYRRNFDVA